MEKTIKELEEKIKKLMKYHKDDRKQFNHLYKEIKKIKQVLKDAHIMSIDA
ncbi:hypothetical protein ES708_11370 [subsurface metagenome]